MRALVIVPTYNERENLKALVQEVLAINERIHMLVVDDNSPDGTGAIAGAIAASEPRVNVLHRAGKLGLGTAYIEGFRYALERDYECVVEMDADFSHRPEDLHKLLAAIEEADVVLGSRNIPGGKVENWSILRRCISRGGSLYARMMLGIQVHDCTGGFKCFRREVLQNIDLDAVTSNGYGFQVEMNFLCHRAGFRIVEVPIVFPDRRVGHSKMSKRIVIEAAQLVWDLRRRALPVTERPFTVRHRRIQVEDQLLVNQPATPVRLTGAPVMRSAFPVAAADTAIEFEAVQE
jgi:dolichol-phosphate mannosyltransferase